VFATDNSRGDRLRESNLECRGSGREADGLVVEGNAPDISELVGEVLLYEGAFGVPDDEAPVRGIQSDDELVVGFDG
jgi:hypothetical protein